jgi:hypothetical protein
MRRGSMKIIANENQLDISGGMAQAFVEKILEANKIHLKKLQLKNKDVERLGDETEFWFEFAGETEGGASRKSPMAWENHTIEITIKHVVERDEA